MFGTKEKFEKMFAEFKYFKLNDCLSIFCAIQWPSVEKTFAPTADNRRVLYHYGSARIGIALRVAMFYV